METSRSIKPGLPIPVTRATRLLCVYVVVTLCLTTLKVLVDLHEADWPALHGGYEAFALGAEAASLVVPLVFYSFVIWKIRQGKNWARYLLLLIFTLYFLYSIAMRVVGVSAGAYSPWPVLAVWTVLMVIHCYAIFLLFTKQSNEWFRTA